MKYFFILLCIFTGSELWAQTISGEITSEGKPMAFAAIYIDNSEIGAVSNAEGYYSLDKVPKGTHVLIVSVMGYRTAKKTVRLSGPQELHIDFSLEPASEQLEEVFLVDEQTGITRRTPYNISTVSMAQIERKGSPNGMMGILREVPGVYGAEFGQGIVKPFIRGLGFSRVVTIYQGNKLENHQWGADHGLGINDLGIQRVDVIKGPASVLYGSGALGGVLLTQDDESYLKYNEFKGNMGFTYNSISNGIRPYASLGKSFKNDFFFASDVAYENHADYKNGDGRLIGNSRFNTGTLRLHLGLEKEHFKNKLSFTSNQQKLGIIDDAEMDDNQTLATDRNDREMQLPFQEVKDYLISYNQSTRHKSFETALHLSHHLNERKEIEASMDLIDLGLKQNHTFYNARVSFYDEHIKHNFGTQGSFVRNKNYEQAQDFLIPDATVFENGIYYMASLDLAPYFIQGAFRYDYRRVTADASSQNLVDYGFVLPGNPSNRKLTRSFDGFTGSLGVTRYFGDTGLLKLNFSTGFRAPDLAELFSNGPHPGTSRFEKGNDQFQREQSLQTDLSYTYRKKSFQGTISTFASQIDNYLYFTATGEMLPEENLELWEYQQTNAGFYGLEFKIKNHWFSEKRLKTTLSGAMVRGMDLGNNSNLTFIPPDNYSLETGYYGLQDKSLYVFSSTRLIADQNRTGQNEDPTGGYVLINLGASKSFKFGKDSFTAALTVHNVLNKNYVDHMSILRAFNVPSPGRNLMLNLNYAF